VPVAVAAGVAVGGARVRSSQVPLHASEAGG